MLLKILIGFVFLFFVISATMTLLYILQKSDKKEPEKPADDVTVGYTSHIPIDD